MTQTLPHRTVIKLIHQMLAQGDADNPTFRRICYAATRDMVLAYATASPGKGQPLKLALAGAVMEVENQLGDGNALDPSLRIFDQPDEPVNKAEEAGATSKTKKDLATVVLSFLVGLTVFVLGAWLLQQTGHLYVHFRSDGFATLKSLNDSRPVVDSALENAEAVLSEARVALVDAIETGKATEFDKANGGLVNIKEYFPELDRSWKNRMPWNAAILFKISPTDPAAYKVVMQSELCTAVALTRPELVDPTRAPYGPFCRFFGYWNDAGKRL